MGTHLAQPRHWYAEAKAEAWVCAPEAEATYAREAQRRRGQ
jgi:hypothetical protein